jgi:hypothetical protein
MQFGVEMQGGTLAEAIHARKCVSPQKIQIIFMPICLP